MPQFCAVVGCGSNSSRDKLSFFRFPSIYNGCGGKGKSEVTINPIAADRRKKWVQALHRENITEKILKNQRVCSKHFVTGRPAKLNDVDHPDWVPSINMGYELAKSLSSGGLERYSRAKKRKISHEPMIMQEPALDPNTHSPLNTVQNDISTNSQNSNIQNSNILVETVDYQTELHKAYQTIYDLKKQLIIFNLDFSSLEQNEEKCKFYTGLNYNTLTTVFGDIEQFIPYNLNSVLTKSQQLLLTLMKLRLNTHFTELGYKFNVDRRTVSRTFYNVIHILYMRFKWLIVWPTREVLQKTMPKTFKEKFGLKTTIIIDCFEIFCETPSKKSASIQHFSHYKSHSTIKFLIGISPQGTIMFLSNAFAGKCSDKYIAEQSGLIEHLSPGDLILADRGFLIAHSVKMQQAELHVPPFLRGRKQLNPVEIEQGRNISNVRIHVERLIGLVKNKFTITHSVLPMHIIKKKQGEATIVDKIITVCCSLCNLCPSVVPLD